MRKKKPRTSLTAARKYKSSIKSPWQGPVVDRNRGSKSNNLPSGAAEYEMISRIIHLESNLDDAIEFGIRAWMSRLEPSQRHMLNQVPQKEAREQAADMMRRQNYDQNKKIMIWGGIPPVAGTAAAIAHAETLRPRKKSKKKSK